MAAKPPMTQPEPGWQLLTAATGRPSRDSLVTARRGHARQAVQRPGSFRPDEPHHHPASDWRLLVSSGPAGQWSVNEGPDHGCELGWGSDARGQDSDPPVHAVRVRDVHQMDRLRKLPDAVTHMPK